MEGGVGIHVVGGFRGHAFAAGFVKKRLGCVSRVSMLGGACPCQICLSRMCFMIWKTHLPTVWGYEDLFLELGHARVRCRYSRIPSTGLSVVFCGMVSDCNGWVSLAAARCVSPRRDGSVSSGMWRFGMPFVEYCKGMYCGWMDDVGDVVCCKNDEECCNVVGHMEVGVVFFGFMVSRF